MSTLRPDIGNLEKTRSLACNGVAVVVEPPPTSRPVTKSNLASDDLTGFSLGQYDLGRSLGRGGMGKVFVAHHRYLQKNFAIKFIGTNIDQLSEAHQRFQQEVLALGKLQHPNIVSAVDAGDMDGIKFLVTELLDGEDLCHVVDRRGPLSLSDACEVVRQVLLGLGHLHLNGYLHRDIKPSNLFLDHSGSVKILDFGLVRNEVRAEQLTTSGEMLGTWDFVAPEQIQDASQADPRSDLYSLGCTIIYLLSGQVPFGGEKYASAPAKLKAHLFEPPTWLTSPPNHLPSRVVEALRSLTEKAPDNRPRNAAELASVFAEYSIGAQLPALINASSLPKDRDTLRRRRTSRLPFRRIFIAVSLLSGVTVGMHRGGLLDRRIFNFDHRQPANVESDRRKSESVAKSEPQPPPPIVDDNDAPNPAPSTTTSASNETAPLPPGHPHPGRVTIETKSTINASPVRVELFPSRKSARQPLQK